MDLLFIIMWIVYGHAHRTNRYILFNSQIYLTTSIQKYRRHYFNTSEYFKLPRNCIRMYGRITSQPHIILHISSVNIAINQLEQKELTIFSLYFWMLVFSSESKEASVFFESLKIISTRFFSRIFHTRYTIEIFHTMAMCSC